ncbi:hypothetical protein TgHK011_009345 [Trichoderma gracile]|nr:hypothetical protein TgHK011_009345 [Trichoderma gracile]
MFDPEAARVWTGRGITSSSPVSIKMRSLSDGDLHQAMPPMSPLPSSRGPIEGDVDIYFGTLPPGMISFSNKKCAHAVTHDCPFLVDSNSTLCTACAYAVAHGQPCP